jgi:RimJ/RimL family protein N-acetyltransferase
MAELPTTILETERLLFRRMVMDDVDALYALCRDEETRRYFPGGTMTFEETQAAVERYLNGHPQNPEMGLWATIHKETQQFIGRCGLLPQMVEGRAEVEISYMIDKRYWRQGLGTEAARGILDYGFEKLKLTRLIGMVDPGNEASARVVATIGMTLEKEAVDEFGPYLLFAMEKNGAEG